MSEEDNKCLNDIIRLVEHKNLEINRLQYWLQHIKDTFPKNKMLNEMIDNALLKVAREK